MSLLSQEQCSRPVRNAKIPRRLGVREAWRFRRVRGVVHQVAGIGVRSDLTKRGLS